MNYVFLHLFVMFVCASVVDCVLGPGLFAFYCELCVLHLFVMFVYTSVVDCVVGAGLFV